jgi:hypothetical protein
MSDMAEGARERRIKWSKRREEDFLIELAASGSVERAADAVGIALREVYRRRIERAEFARKWDEAIAAGWSRLELKLLEGAMAGAAGDGAGLTPAVIAALLKRMPARGAVKAKPENPEVLRQQIMEKFARIKRRLEKDGRGIGG